MEMHYTYAGTITKMRGGVFTEVPGTRYYDAIDRSERANFAHVSGDPARALRFAHLSNMLPIGALA